MANLKTNLGTSEVRLHSLIVRPSQEPPMPRGSWESCHLVLEPFTHLSPLKPSEVEAAECPQAGAGCPCSLLAACHQYPHLSVVLVT